MSIYDEINKIKQEGNPYDSKIGIDDIFPK